MECLLCKQEDLGSNLQHHVAGIAVQDAREARHVGMLAVEAACWQPWRDSLGSLRVEGIGWHIHSPSLPWAGLDLSGCTLAQPTLGDLLCQLHLLTGE